MSATEIRILEPGDEAAAEAFLLPHVETSMFLIGNMRNAGLVDHGEVCQGTYAAAFEDGRITRMLSHCWNGNVILQAPDHLDALLWAAIHGSGRPVCGLIGPHDQVEAARRALAIDEAAIQMDDVENLYTLDLADLIVPEPLHSGEVSGRQAEPSDLDQITAWRIAYKQEALGAEDTPEMRQQTRDEMARATEAGITWVLEKDGRLVASTSFNTAIKEAVQVGGVWTPPDLRGRGYARAAVAVSLIDARSDGAQRAILFTGQAHIAAQKAYTALGFRHIGDYHILLLRTPLKL